VKVTRIGSWNFQPLLIGAAAAMRELANQLITAPMENARA